MEEKGPIEDESWKTADFLSLGDGGEEGDDQDEEESDDRPQPPQQEELPPWMEYRPVEGRVNPLVALHNEIVDFCSLMAPYPEEVKERERLTELVKSLAYATFGADKVRF